MCAAGRSHGSVDDRMWKSSDDSKDDASKSAGANTESAYVGASTAFDGDITGKITVLTNRTDLVDTDLKRYAEVFEQKYPGTEVEYLPMEDYESDTSILFTVGEIGDLCLIPASIAPSEFKTYLSLLVLMTVLQTTICRRLSWLTHMMVSCTDFQVDVMCQVLPTTSVCSTMQE